MTHFFLNQTTDVIGWRSTQPATRTAFLARVADWHAVLARLAGKQFALHLHDRIEFAAALLGAWQARKTVWLSADALRPSVDALRISVDGFIGDFPADCLPISASVGQVHSQPVLPEHDFVGLVVYTSGSNGMPQAIPKKIGQLTSEVTTLEKLFGAHMGHADVLSTVSHQHIYGLLFTVLWPLYAGRPIYADTLSFPEQLAQQLALRPSVLISSPAHLKRLPQHLHWPRCQAVFCSGGVLDAEVAISNAIMLGTTPIEVYGSSETGGIAWRERKRVDLEGSWRAMPDVDWRVEPESQCIQIRSPHLFTDDWQTLADRITRAEDDRFILLGRSDRIVKIEEKRVSLDAIEQVLLTGGLVAEIRLIVDTVEFGVRQQLAAVVVLSDSGQKILREHGKLEVSRQLKQFLQLNVEQVAIPRRWRFVESLPVNAQGKTTHAQLRALFQEPAKMIAPTYTERVRDLDHAEFDVQWRRDLPYFKGHFPDAPVLPGVAQVHWAIQIGREAFAISANFQSMHGLKFHHVVFPDEVTRLKLQYDVARRCLSFSYATATKTAFQREDIFSCVTHKCGAAL